MSTEIPDVAARKTRRRRFETVAARRTVRVLKNLRLLGNCANRRAYEYTPADVDKIFHAIEQELQLTRSKFADRKEIDFKLG